MVWALESSEKRNLKENWMPPTKSCKVLSSMLSKYDNIKNMIIIIYF